MQGMLPAAMIYTLVHDVVVLLLVIMMCSTHLILLECVLSLSAYAAHGDFTLIHLGRKFVAVSHVSFTEATLPVTRLAEAALAKSA